MESSCRVRFREDSHLIRPGENLGDGICLGDFEDSCCGLMRLQQIGNILEGVLVDWDDGVGEDYDQDYGCKGDGGE